MINNHTNEFFTDTFFYYIAAYINSDIFTAAYMEMIIALIYAIWLSASNLNSFIETFSSELITSSILSPVTCDVLSSAKTICKDYFIH